MPPKSKSPKSKTPKPPSSTPAPDPAPTTSTTQQPLLDAPAMEEVREMSNKLTYLTVKIDSMEAALQAMKQEKEDLLSKV